MNPASSCGSVRIFSSSPLDGAGLQMPFMSKTARGCDWNSSHDHSRERWLCRELSCPTCVVVAGLSAADSIGLHLLDEPCFLLLFSWIECRHLSRIHGLDILCCSLRVLWRNVRWAETRKLSLLSMVRDGADQLAPKVDGTIHSLRLGCVLEA